MAEYENIIDLNKLGRFYNNLKDKGLPLSDWQANKEYKLGYTVIQDGKLYRCNTEHTSTTTFDDTKWEEISSRGIPYYTSNTSYKVDDQVVYDNKIYKCVTAHTSTSTFDDTKWEEISSGGGISVWQANTDYEVNDVVIDDNLIWQCVVAHTSTNTFDESKWEEISGGGILAWKSNKNYKVGTMVVYRYCIYMCKVAHTSTSEFDYSKWIVMSSTVGSSADPVGTIISYMGNTPPVNYLACDGTIYNIADYQDLAEHINTQFGSYDYFGGDGITTFAVPDLRGEFLRGTGTNSHTNQGSGANVGVHQDGTIHSNISVDPGAKTFYVSKPTMSDANNSDSNVSEWSNGTQKEGRIGIAGITDTYTAGYGGSLMTSRPTNTSVLYCIKYTEPGVVYSTEEQRIGTWIDGKPLYQKTLVKTGGVANDTIYFNDELTNIDYLQKISASFNTNVDRYESEYITSSSNKLQVITGVSNNKGQIYTIFASRTVYEMYVTVQYTKI